MRSKICTRCKKDLLISEYYPLRPAKNGDMVYFSRCKICCGEVSKEKRASLTKEEKQYIYQRSKKLRGHKFKGYALKHKYNMSYNDLIIMYEEQNKKCYICNKEIAFNGNSGGLRVDHCHRTNKVRKLLCHLCNSLLGSAQEKIEILENAIKYLKEHDNI